MRRVLLLSTKAGHTGSVRRGISTLVITVKGDVQTEVLGQTLIVAKSKHV